MQKTSWRRVLPFIIVAIVLVGGYSLFRVVKSDGKAAQTAIPYPSGWQDTGISGAERIVGVILKANRNRPKSSVLALKSEVKLDKNFDIKTLPNQMAAAFKKKLGDITIVSNVVGKVRNLDTVEFRYKQASDGNNYESLILVIPLSNVTFYLNYRAEDDNFEGLQNQYTDIANSFVDKISGN